MQPSPVPGVKGSVNVDTVQVGRTPWNAIFSIVVALLYDASPIDLLPDVIPLLGWLDDGIVTVLMVVFAVASWRKWAKRRKIQSLKALQPL